MLRSAYLVVLLSFGCTWLSGQTGNPVVTQQVPAQTAVTGGTPITIDLRNHFGLLGITGQIVRMNTSLGAINIEMRADAAPRHVENFLNYVRSGAYTNTFFHRSFVLSGTSVSIIQGGGYRFPIPVTTIPKNAPVPLEYNLPNARGTLAAARTDQPDTATSEWYFNIVDNSTTLGPSNGGGYTVFGRVIGAGLSVLDAIAGVPVYNAGAPFTHLPLRNYTSGNIVDANLVAVTSASLAEVYPGGSSPAVLTFNATTQNANVAAVSVSGSTLTITPGTEAGAFNLTVRATDTNGQFAITPIAIAVTSSTVAPTIVRQPASQTVAAGGSVAFEVAVAGSPATYAWSKNDQTIAGATGPILLLSNVGAADAGTYSVVVTNSAGSVTSSGAALTVAAAGGKARLNNLSVRSVAGLGDQLLIAGFNVGGSAPSNLVIRGIGPTLGVFGVSGFVADPRLELFNAQQALVAVNDDWSGADGSAVGGFALPAGSKDAVLSRSLAVGGYTAQVKGAGTTVGEALVEVYEAPPVSTASELSNLSARTQLAAGQILVTGFNIGPGSARTVLVRAIGPTLSAFGVNGTLANPRIELFASNGTQIGGNDDWGGNAVLVNAMASVGAFALSDGASRDSALLVTLPPGGYTAQVAGVAGSAGVVLVELYLLP